MKLLKHEVFNLFDKKNLLLFLYNAYKYEHLIPEYILCLMFITSNMQMYSFLSNNIKQGNI